MNGGGKGRQPREKGLTAKEKRRKYVSKKKRQKHSASKNHDKKITSARSEGNSHQVSESTKNLESNIALMGAKVEDFRTKKGMKQRNEISTQVISSQATPESSKVVHHRFEVDETDHCETPLEAYKDIVSILDYWAKCIGKNRADLVMYDPYYCSGGIKGRLGSLGFKNVLNENEDFYDNIEKGSIPEYDVLLTNPPYSGIHIEKLLKFASGSTGRNKSMKKYKNRDSKNSVTGSQKPFLLLLPHFVYTKDYYKRIYPAGDDNLSHPFFLCPRSRYNYVPPSWVSEEGSTSIAKGKVKTAPFPSFWYCNGGKGIAQKDLSSFLVKTYGESGAFKGFDSKKLQYARCTEHIPREMRGELDTNKKRPNPRARKRMMAKKRKAMAP
mmetsp:Transcript_28245/g.39750  ORF Transcript_28245/g.39750 Transcript_28245/m.39750 type:complete len:383 (-) Transcript_28245:169-1317(-)